MPLEIEATKTLSELSSVQGISEEETSLTEEVFLEQGRDYPRQAFFLGEFLHTPSLRFDLAP